MCFEMTKVHLFKGLKIMFKSSIRILPLFFSMIQFGRNFHFFSWVVVFHF